MGKQGSERPLKINTKKQRARHECMEELNAFMACMAVSCHSAWEATRC